MTDLPKLPPADFEVTIANKLEARSSSLLNTFLEIDFDRTGKLHRSEFKIAMHNIFGIDLTDEQVHRIFKRIGKGIENDQVCYKDFVEYIGNTTDWNDNFTFSQLVGLNKELQEKGNLSNGNSVDLFHEMKIVPKECAITRQLRHDLKEKIYSRYSGNISGRGIDTETFLALDSDKCGLITPSHFSEWLQEIGFELSGDECRKVLGEYWNETGIALLDFIHFLDSLDVDECKEITKVGDNEGIPEDDSHQLRNSLKEYSSKDLCLLESFRSFHSQHSTIDKVRLLRKLLEEGLGIDEMLSSRILSKWDKKLDASEFIDLIVGEVATSQIGTSFNREDIEAIKSFCRSIESDYMNTRQGFLSLDRSKTRQLTHDDLVAGFQKYGIDIEVDFAKRIIHKVNKDGETMNFAQYIQMISTHLSNLE